nr:NlpC/P60 family protein [Vibrio tritonius]
MPYRWGGNTQSGVDCSAFVQIAFQDAWQISLPRTTKSQSNTGKKINRKDAHYGDLVFFRINSTLEHVGVYIGNQRFMHASSSKGVIISRLDNPYWASKFWQFRRISRPYTVR